MHYNTIRVVLDTNVWISSLIGRTLVELRELLSNPSIELITTPRLRTEVLSVTERPKFRKYFSEEHVADLLAWMDKYMVSVELGEVPRRCRDVKDDYLLELAIQAEAIYLVSGDEDLLEIGEIEGCKIMTIAQFRQVILDLR